MVCISIDMRKFPSVSSQSNRARELKRRDWDLPTQSAGWSRNGIFVVLSSQSPETIKTNNFLNSFTFFHAI